MALHTVGELKSSLEGLLQGAKLDKVGDLNGKIQRAARTVVQQAGIPEASGKEALVLYSGVPYYLAPTTIFGTAINLIRKQGDAVSPIDYNYKVPVDIFSRERKLLPNGYMIDFEYDDGVALMGIQCPGVTPKNDLDPMNSDTGWTAAGSASGLAEDTAVYYQSPASLRFQLAGASTGTLTKAITSRDLSSYEDVGVAFLAIYAPAVSNLTSISLKIGSSASAYDEVSKTTGFLGAFKAGEWLLVAFDFSAATTTGTPDWAAIDYVQVSVVHAGAIANFRVGGLWISLPNPVEILFQSSAIFKASSAAPLQAITADGDTILLNDAAYTLLEYEAALQISMGQGGGLADSQIQKFQTLLYEPNTGLYAQYRADNPSEELRTLGSYYNGPGYGN